MAVEAQHSKDEEMDEPVEDDDNDDGDESDEDDDEGDEIDETGNEQAEAAPAIKNKPNEKKSEKKDEPVVKEKSKVKPIETKTENAKLLEDVKDEEVPKVNSPNKNIQHFWTKVDNSCNTTCRIILGVSGVCLISFTGIIVLAGVVLLRSSSKKKNIVLSSPAYQETWI